MDDLTAGDALLRCGIDIAQVRRRLPAVEPFAVPVRLAPRWFRATWAKGIVAVTTPRAIYVDADVYRRLVGAEAATEGGHPTGSKRDGLLMVHELTHLEQYRRLGAGRHIRRYVGDYLSGRFRGRRHWDAYRDIGLEREARDVAAGFDGPTPR